MNPANPTNKELKETIERHTAEDELHFNAIYKEFDAVHARFDSVASKGDIIKLDEKLDPVLDAYKAILFSKSFITGLAAVVVAITAIGAGFIWLVNSVRH